MRVVRDGLCVELDSAGYFISVQRTENQDGAYIGEKRADIVEEKKIMELFNRDIKGIPGIKATVLQFALQIVKAHDKAKWKPLVDLPKPTKGLYTTLQKAGLPICLQIQSDKYKFVGFGVNIIPYLMKEGKGINFQSELFWNAIDHLEKDPAKGTFLADRIFLITNESETRFSFILKLDYEVYNSNV